MIIQKRTLVSSFATAASALATGPTVSTQQSPAKTPYQFGTGLERIAKSSAHWAVAAPLVKSREAAMIGVVTSYGRNKAISEAKQLANDADNLRWSDRPSDRLRAYELMREAGEKLKNVDPKVAQEFEKAAQLHLFFDQKVNQYQGLRALGYSKEQADSATYTPNFPSNRGAELNEAMFTFGRAYGALDRM